ncbi:MAG TPA: DeoR/GlpR family DNA-binding transcription regulator [Spirochaetia bacterium]|nr:DeoR/GlpR family DNA-binding transcription regulator [Spirochaetia bacterium]
MNILSSARRRTIVEIVSRKRAVTITELAEAFPVSPVTLRRDLDRLAGENLIERVHGGAMARSAITVAPPASEQYRHLSDEQLAIGREASARIRDGDYVILESGSTCLAVVPHLRARRNLRVVTASPRLASALAALVESETLAMEIICSGGTLSVHKDFFLGPHARTFFEACRVDLALLSVTAIDLEAGITADSLTEAEISRTILEKSARRRIGLIVSKKLERTSFARVGAAETLQEIITDAGADPLVLERYRKRGIHVTVV